MVKVKKVINYLKKKVKSTSIQSNLSQAITKFGQIMGLHQCSICNSNSIRRIHSPK